MQRIVTLIGYASISILISLLFYYYPQIDIWFSGLFFKNNHFFLRQNNFLTYIHQFVPIITKTIILLCLALLILYILLKRSILDLTPLKVAYILLALLIGPGLIINTTLKNNWGRARPYTIEEFGGDKKFSPAFVMTNQCKKNCSFSSGDPSVGFVMFTLVFLYGSRWMWLPLSLGGVFGLTRIMQGAHFLSDVVISGIITVWVCYLLYLALIDKKSH